MTTIVSKIYDLLDVDGTQPNAQGLAKDRLRELNVPGVKCSRCDGTGKYSYNRYFGDVCVKCNGRGAVGTALTRLAFDQLKAMEAAGTLGRSQKRWRAHEFVRKAHFSLVQIMKRAGLEGKYGYVGPNAKPGEWDYDLKDMHEQMKEICARFGQLVDVKAFAQMSDQKQSEVLSVYMEAYEAAKAHLEKLTREFDSYMSWNIRPDYHAKVLRMVRGSRSDTPK